MSWKELGPSLVGRAFHTLTVVGDLVFLYGGATQALAGSADGGDQPMDGVGESDAFFVRIAPRKVDWSDDMKTRSSMGFTKIFDGDAIKVAGDKEMTFDVTLCSEAWLPCDLFIGGGGTLKLLADSRFICDGAQGCTSMQLHNITLVCDTDTFKTAPMQVSAESKLEISLSTIDGCSSSRDGGAILAYDRSTIQISDSTFKRSSSQVT